VGCWQGWVIRGWGIGLALNDWHVYFQRLITDDEIRREVETGNQTGPGTMLPTCQTWVVPVLGPDPYGHERTFRHNRNPSQ